MPRALFPRPNRPLLVPSQHAMPRRFPRGCARSASPPPTPPSPTPTSPVNAGWASAARVERIIRATAKESRAGSQSASHIYSERAPALGEDRSIPPRAFLFASLLLLGVFFLLTCSKHFGCLPRLAARGAAAEHGTVPPVAIHALTSGPASAVRAASLTSARPASPSTGG